MLKTLFAAFGLMFLVVNAYAYDYNQYYNYNNQFVDSFQAQAQATAQSRKSPRVNLLSKAVGARMLAGQDPKSSSMFLGLQVDPKNQQQQQFVPIQRNNQISPMQTMQIQQASQQFNQMQTGQTLPEQQRLSQMQQTQPQQFQQTQSNNNDIMITLPPTQTTTNAPITAPRFRNDMDANRQQNMQSMIPQQQQQPTLTQQQQQPTLTQQQQQPTLTQQQQMQQQQMQQQIQQQIQAQQLQQQRFPQQAQQFNQQPTLTQQQQQPTLSQQQQQPTLTQQQQPQQVLPQQVQQPQQPVQQRPVIQQVVPQQMQQQPTLSQQQQPTLTQQQQPTLTQQQQPTLTQQQQQQQQQQQIQQQQPQQQVASNFCGNHQPGDLLPHPSNQNQFVICFGVGEFTIMDCPDHLVYNPNTQRCENDLSTPLGCQSNPCMNNGKCVDLPFFQFRCECPTGFSGPSCERLDTCATSPCGPGGICITMAQGSPLSHVCLCSSAKVVGQTCSQSVEINPCTTPNSNFKRFTLKMNPSMYVQCEGLRPHFKFCQHPLVFSQAKQACDWN